MIISKNTMRILRSCWGAGACVLLAGCGETELNPKGQPLQLTSSNAQIAVAKVADATKIMTGAGGGGGRALAANLAPASPERDSPSHFNVADLAGSTLQKLFAAAPTRSTVASQLVSVNAAPCAVSGSFSYTWNDKDNNGQLSVNDEISGTLNQCVEEPGLALNGGIAFIINDLIGNPAAPLTAWWLSATLDFNQIRVSEGSKSWSLNGRHLSFTSSTADGITYNGSLSGAALGIEGPQGGTTLGTFIFEYAHDKNTLAYSTHGTGTLVNDQMGGRVTFLSLQLFKGIGTGNPTEGSMQIFGAKNTDGTARNIVFTATGGDNVRIDVDANGDHQVEEFFLTTWTAMGV